MFINRHQTISSLHSFDTESCHGCIHGKGARCNAVDIIIMDCTIVEFDIISPNRTLITNVNESNTDLFNAARIVIGSLDIITRFIAQAVDLPMVTRMRRLNYYNVSNDRHEFGEIEDYVNNEMTAMLDEFDVIYGGWQTFREQFQMKRWYFTDRIQTNNLTYDFINGLLLLRTASTSKAKNFCTQTCVLVLIINMQMQTIILRIFLQRSPFPDRHNLTTV